MSRTQDQLDIVRATHTYALGLDTFEPEVALSAFAEGAVWDATAAGLERYEGLEQIREFLGNDAKSIARQLHVLTNHLVDEDHARGTNDVFSQAGTASGSTSAAIAPSEDTCVRPGDGWRIESRVISPLTTPEMEGFEV